MAEPDGAAQERVEHRLRVRLGVRDCAENLARCGLLVERRHKLAIAGLEFFEQAHILDGDHGLIGEGLQQADLFLRERPGFGS